MALKLLFFGAILYGEFVFLSWLDIHLYLIAILMLASAGPMSYLIFPQKEKD
jgi:hypothetical protein